MVLGLEADLSEWGALFLGLAAFVTAMTGMTALLVGQRSSHRKIDTVLGAVNHVDEEITEHGQATLGQRVKQIQRQLERGFEQNDKVHARLERRLNQLEDGGG